MSLNSNLALTKVWSGSVYSTNDIMILSDISAPLYIIEYKDHSSVYYAYSIIKLRNIIQIGLSGFDASGNIVLTRYRMSFDSSTKTITISEAKNADTGTAIIAIYKILG